MMLTIYQLKSKRKNSAVKLRRRSQPEKKFAKKIQENVNNTGQKNERGNNSQNVHAKQNVKYNE